MDELEDLRARFVSGFRAVEIQASAEWNPQVLHASLHDRRGMRSSEHGNHVPIARRVLLRTGERVFARMRIDRRITTETALHILDGSAALRSAYVRAPPAGV